MRSNKISRILITITAVFIIVPMFALTAYAYTDGSAGREVDLGGIPAPVATPEPAQAPEPQSLTPPGNLTLVDDISGAQAADKQFITVVTKSGNYFYLIIDRAGDKENVYFLNLVDEADLMAILEKDKKPATTTPVTVTPVPEPSPNSDPDPEPQKSGGPGGLIVMLLLIGALGGSAYYYFKILKPKKAIKATATTELDDFDFDADEDDFDSEDTGGEAEAMEDDGDEDMPDFMLPDELADDTGPDSGDDE